MAPELETHLTMHSRVLSRFKAHSDLEIARLMHVDGQKLCSGSAPTETGPECVICRERRFALLVNPGCEHAACEDCWASWMETQIPACRAQKNDVTRCIGAGCQAPSATALWSHSCSRNMAVKGVNQQLLFRRRLQTNPLYPADVQDECPRHGCVGLGYRGYATVMCFVCEHQWSPDAAAPPCPFDIQNSSVELLPGEAMKKCPGCGEHIIKNGGCDHMKCHCGHEFWWTTLLPYTYGRVITIPV